MIGGISFGKNSGWGSAHWGSVSLGPFLKEVPVGELSG